MAEDKYYIFEVHIKGCESKLIKITKINYGENYIQFYRNDFLVLSVPHHQVLYFEERK